MFPSETPSDKILQGNFDGLVLSNGPGDPEDNKISIQTIKEIFLPILKKYNINKCYLFGSYAKNIARDNSDIDLLVETDMTGLAYLNLIEELRDALHKKVDLLNLNDVSENNPISLRILKEGVLLKDD